MKKVLVVDDEAETVRMLSMAVELLGFQPVGVDSGERALEEAKRDAPDAVLLDLMMPGMDGFEVARRLRADPATAATPIVVVSAMAEADVEDRCRAAGANAFLAKPVNLGELLDLLKEFTQ